MIDKVLKTIDKEQLLTHGDGVVVALSGGADSVALAEMLMALQPTYGLKLVAVHVNHLLRGEAAEADAEWVAKWCAEKGLPLEVFRKDVADYAQRHKLSVEQAGRDVRYRCFEEIRQAYGFQKIASGHHKNDVTESFFLNLFRGAGITGLSSIAYRKGNRVRPLLDVTKAEINAYLDAKGIAYCTDHTNDENDYTRNKIRNVLLPQLRASFNPNIDETIGHTVALMKCEEAFWSEHISNVLNQISKVDEAQNYVMIEREGFARCHRAEKYRLLRACVERLEGSLKDISYGALTEVLALNETGKQKALSGAYTAYLTAEHLYVAKADVALYRRGDYRLSVSRITRSAWSGKTASKCEIAVDADAVVGALSIRYRQNGDSFIPLGMTGRKKLKDFFIDEKVPREKRDTIPLICDDEKILWVFGMRQDARSKVCKKTENILIIRLE
ncbi:tRNA lysidine(34) synthetase TilS [Fusibacter sp. JL298sf-3]